MEVSAEVLAALRERCLALPEVSEEPAWVGTRWVVRRKNFAHVLTVVDGHPAAYAAAAGSAGPITVLTFRSRGAELDALAHAGHPFFRPPWLPDIVGMVLERPDWAEVAELITESYCLLAPRRLADRVRG